MWTIFVSRIEETENNEESQRVCICVGCVIFEDFTKQIHEKQFAHIDGLLFNN